MTFDMDSDAAFELGRSHPLTREVQAIAERQAREDRDLLARFVRSGVAKRSGPGTTPEHRAFIADIERRARPRPPVNPTIIPKSKRRKRR